MHTRSVAAAAVAFVLTTGVGHAQNFGASRDASVRVEWQVGQTDSGRSTITGVIFNDDDFWTMTAIRLLIEEVDSLGRPVRQTVAYVDSHVGPGGQVSFEVSLRPGGHRYRVTVESVDWFTGQPGAP